MKIPLLPIHYKPKQLISRILENYGDCVIKVSLKDTVVNVPESAEPCFAVNVRNLIGPFFLETSSPFYGIRCGEYVDNLLGVDHGE